MQTKTQLSPLEAAKLTGTSKATINRALNAGELSGRRDPDTNRWFIEPAELFRVFPPIASGDELARQLTHEPTRSSAEEHKPAQEPVAHGGAEGDASAGSYMERLKSELAVMSERLNLQKQERERERGDHQETIRDLRERLDRAETERRQKDAQLTALLTDQTEKAKAAAEAPQRRGWFGFSRKAASA